MMTERGKQVAISNLDLPVLTNNDVVVHDHGNAGDNALQSQGAEDRLAPVLTERPAIRSGTDPEMHRTITLFIAAHDTGTRRALLVGAEPHLSSDLVGILIAVFLQIGADLLRFETAGDIHDSPVLDCEFHRIFPQSR